ncbi:family 20 glycosylhydrolase [Pontibacter sp. SGAir0037]|uniref:family 20 glycosylhydrolase n=1 Tax=Pontibacter sp. SGAir0037 TaxID=2571030 RepID=UPI0010CD0F4F|nr:family 20 glycosylhydrolase [Pontibacter sp. SGAir0037]QCR21960.1 beta-N-acetylhexosaminidase [Pontibacter sp. SGAir0037]
MKGTLLALLLVLCTFSLSAQNAPAYNPEHLKITWEVLQSGYENKLQFQSAFTFTNTGKTALPASGWKLYFNFHRRIDPKTIQDPFTIRHINGDLYQLSPAEGFKGLAPGASQLLKFVSSYVIVNMTDAPSGFYLVWNQAPEKGHSITQVDIKPAPAPDRSSGITLITPSDVYNQNKNIQHIPVDQLTKIFPTPARYQETKGSFTLTENTSIVSDAAFSKEANLLAESLAAFFNKKPAIATSGKGKVIRLQKKNGLEAEAYELQVTPQEITIAASTPAGIFYGCQSLKTMLPPAVPGNSSKAVAIQAVEVSDAPRFGHRAFMLDVARNFQQKEQVLKLLDVMALYKLNVLHFHLIDDEGWRLEIPSLPELTQVGARRGHTLDGTDHLQVSLGSGPDPSKAPGSGYYSREDFVQIIRYANDRHIRVIPEIETPGHARASIKAMDARYERLMAAGKAEEAKQYLLRDLQDKSTYRSVQNWNDNVIDVALPSTYAFMETVVDNIVAMYKEAGAPLNTIHFGGDEVPAGVWEKSPAVQSLIKSNTAVKNTDDLWYYYFGKLNSMLKSRGLSLYGWEEIGLRKTKVNGKTTYVPNPDFVKENFQVDVWNNLAGAEDLAYKLANAGYKVVLSNVTNMYFDLAYTKEYEEPGLYWGGFVDIDKPFYFIPFNYYKNAKEDNLGRPINPAVFKGKEQLSEKGKLNIVGLQAALWSEMVTTPKRMEYMLLPKLLGLAERAWATDPAWATEADTKKSEELYRQAWSQFTNIVGKRELPRLDHYAGGFNYRIPAPGAIVQNGAVTANLQLPGFTIRYTTDGSEPTAQSKVYTSPIAEKGTIKMKAFNSLGRGSRTVTVQHK